jgi:nucleoside-diphosphate-sugar epimerase
MIPIKNRRIMLIGGAGFIGHNLALKLKELGADVCVVDGLQVNNILTFQSSKEKSANRQLYLYILNQRLEMLRSAGIPLYAQDARDYYALSYLFTDIKPQVVVQLAAVAHSNKSNKDPYSTFDHSFRTLENALDSSRDRVEHFIYFSSSMVYGHFNGKPVDETTPCEPLGIYGALKFGGEKLVIAYNQAFNLPYTIIRPSALYGERCVSRRVGQVFIENALKGADINIAGDGTDALDFTCIHDMVDGLIKVIENPASINQILNMTYGEARHLSQMATIVQSYFPGVSINYVPKDKLMPDRGTLSVAKARKLIGYNPQWSLEKGLPAYIEWYKSLPENLTQADMQPVTYG